MWFGHANDVSGVGWVCARHDMVPLGGQMEELLIR